jgi:hypothetical protein
MEKHVPLLKILTHCGPLHTFLQLGHIRFEETVHCICFVFLGATLSELFVNSYPVDEINLV